MEFHQDRQARQFVVHSSYLSFYCCCTFGYSNSALQVNAMTYIAFDHHMTDMHPSLFIQRNYLIQMLSHRRGIDNGIDVIYSIDNEFVLISQRFNATRNYNRRCWVSMQPMRPKKKKVALIISPLYYRLVLDDNEDFIS